MYSGFRDDVGVESVAQVDRVDVVTIVKRSLFEAETEGFLEALYTRM